MRIRNIDLASIRVPLKHRRIEKDDGTITSSLETEGLKDPVIVVASDNEYILADGSRRVQAARRLKWNKIKASVRKPQNGMGPDAYASFLRLTINHHRQGFYPSQRAHYLKILNDKYGVPVKDIAKACGVKERAARIWMAVNDCSEEVQMFIDDGKFPVDAGGLLRSLKPQGQMLIVDKFRNRPKVAMNELKTAVSNIHRRHPHLIKVSLSKVTQSKKPRDHKKVERKAYGRNVGMSIADLEQKILEYERDITFMRREILRSAPIIKKICKSGKIRLALPGDVLKRFDVFLSED